MSASVLSGARLIWLVNKASWSVVTAQVSLHLAHIYYTKAIGPGDRTMTDTRVQAPAMGTIWILTIVQLPLSRCVPCLAAVAGWVWWTGMNVYP